MEPTVGRIVHYRLGLVDLERLALNHPLAKTVRFPDGSIERVEWNGNALRVGDTYPLVVVRPWHQTGFYERGVSCLNGQVLLDGPGTLWATSVHEGDEAGTWSWPPRS